jgi:hypothetical protein
LRQWPEIPKQQIYWALRDAETQYRSRALLGIGDRRENLRRAEALRECAERICRREGEDDGR